MSLASNFIRPDSRVLRLRPSFRGLRIERLEFRHLLTSVTLLPSHDTSLYEDEFVDLSNGEGEYLFVGRTNPRGGPSLRRAMLRFDVASEIPAGATINSVSLELNVSKTISGPEPVALHRVMGEWGEGDSDADGEEGEGAPAADGDATWLHRQFPTETWDTPGGDFVQDASGSTDVAGLGQYTWTAPEMVADVEAWLLDSSQNFGWILLGNEFENGTAKRFDSRENTTEANRPTLTIDFDAPAGAPWQNADLPEDVTGDGLVVPLDALLVINRLNSVGAGPLPTPSESDAPPPFFDVDGDNQVAPIDALLVINLLNIQASQQQPAAAAPVAETESDKDVPIGETALTWMVSVGGELPGGADSGDSVTRGAKPSSRIGLAADVVMRTWF